MVNAVLFALSVGFCLTFLLVGVFRWRHPRHPAMWKAAVFLFAILFLVVLVAGVWQPNYGSPWGQGYWVTFVLVGSVAAMFLAAAPPERRPPPEATAEVAEYHEKEISGTVFGVFFWMLLLSLGLVLGIRLIH